MIEVAELCGFCAGARISFEKALQAITDNPGKRIVLFNRLLHNQDVVKALENKGNVVRIDNREEFKPDDVIIIRAHGETKDTIEYLKSRGFNCVDCTCQKVDRIHKSIEKKYRDGYKIFIVGQKTGGITGEKKIHAEVSGSNGWCNNTAEIVETADDIKASGDFTTKNIFVAAQTTFNQKKYTELSQLIKEKYAASNVEVMDNSLCGIQGNAHAASVKLAKQCGTMLVIGDKDSANTAELYAKCRAVCPDTRLVEARQFFYKKIMQGTFNFSANTGITGGSSTPIDIIRECKHLLKFKEFYEAVRKKISGKIQLYNQKLLQDNSPLFQDAIEQFAAIGAGEKAKYIRGSLLALGYRMAGEQHEDYSLDLAAAYEFFETAILVHDDVFDKADKRRGVATVHKKTEEKYLAGHEDQGELIRSTAGSVAVCAGDLGFYFLNQIILDAYKNDKQLVSVLSFFNAVVIKTIKGELLDIALPLEEQLQIPRAQALEDLVLEIDTAKTAEYTTIGPFCLGLILGGAGQQDIEIYKELFLYLGIAFQIIDDWLNIYGTPEQGKPIGNDITEYKMTLFYSEVCKNEEMKKQLLKYYGRNISAEDILEVKALFERSGAKEKIKKKIQDYISKCRAIVETISFRKEEDKDILLGFILFLELRFEDAE